MTWHALVFQLRVRCTLSSNNRLCLTTANLSMLPWCWGSSTSKIDLSLPAVTTEAILIASSIKVGPQHHLQPFIVFFAQRKFELRHGKAKWSHPAAKGPTSQMGSWGKERIYSILRTWANSDEKRLRSSACHVFDHIIRGFKQITNKYEAMTIFDKVIHKVQSFWVPVCQIFDIQAPLQNKMGDVRMRVQNGAWCWDVWLIKWVVACRELCSSNFLLHSDMREISFAMLSWASSNFKAASFVEILGYSHVFLGNVCELWFKSVLWYMFGWLFTQ